MVPSPSGLIPKKGLLEDAIARFNFQDIAINVHNIDPLIDSADISFLVWNILIEIITHNQDAYDGFVITHGTDSMVYTAAAMFFALHALKKPIILTGAMYPLNVEKSDAEDNLRGAIQAAITGKPGSQLWFSRQSLPGDRLVKAATQRMDAFRATEYPALKILPNFKTVCTFKPHRIATITASPNMDKGMVEAMLAHADGVLLRCFGAGTFPSNADLGEALHKATQKGVPIIAVSQCENGNINLDNYAASSHLKKHGVLSGGRLTTEAAFILLSLTLSGFPFFPLPTR